MPSTDYSNVIKVFLYLANIFYFNEKDPEDVFDTIFQPGNLFTCLKNIKQGVNLLNNNKYFESRTDNLYLKMHKNEEQISKHKYNSREEEDFKININNLNKTLQAYYNSVADIVFTSSPYIKKDNKIKYEEILQKSIDVMMKKNDEYMNEDPDAYPSSEEEQDEDTIAAATRAVETGIDEKDYETETKARINAGMLTLDEIEKQRIEHRDAKQKAAAKKAEAEEERQRAAETGEAASSSDTRAKPVSATLSRAEAETEVANMVAEAKESLKNIAKIFDEYKKHLTDPAEWNNYKKQILEDAEDDVNSIEMLAYWTSIGEIAKQGIKKQKTLRAAASLAGPSSVASSAPATSAMGSKARKSTITSVATAAAARRLANSKDRHQMREYTVNINKDGGKKKKKTNKKKKVNKKKTYKRKPTKKRRTKIRPIKRTNTKKRRTKRRR